MLAGTAISVAVSPAALPRRNRSPLNPLFRPRASSQSASTTTTTKTHLSNLDRLLQKQQAQAPPFPAHDHPRSDSPPRGGGGSIFDCLNLPSLFPSRATTEQMSPRSLTKLQRLLSDTTRPSPRNAIAPTWHQYHGAGDWAGLLDPLDENLRRELIRCGDLVQSAYHAFHSNPSVPPNHHRSVILPDRNYKVTRSLYATASVELPGWVTGVAPWITQQRTSWIGFVAVCDNEREIQRMGRRDIVISLRGTATCLEWAENFRAGLVPIDNNNNNYPIFLSERSLESPDVSAHAPSNREDVFRNNNKVTAKVECGFWSLYKTASAGSTPSLSEAVVDEVNRLMELYKGEELSITVTGHSLGAALAVLAGDELSRLPGAPPVAVFSFGGPRVGNRSFADRVRKGGAKVLRVVNANDVVTRVPVKMPERVLMDGYADVGTELKVDSKVSPYLRPDADPACCHDLEAYLHLVDGFLGSHCPFRSNAKRSLARLLNEQGSNVKKLYMTKARDLAVDPAAVAGAGSNVPSCLPSPSH